MYKYNIPTKTCTSSLTFFQWKTASKKGQFLTQKNRRKMTLRGMGHEVLKSFLLFIFIYKIFYNLFYRKSHAPCPDLVNGVYKIRIKCRGMTKFLMPHFCPLCPEIRIFWRFSSKNSKKYFSIQNRYCQKWGKTGHNSVSCPDSKKG